MGKFDLDEFLKDLGDGDAGAEDFLDSDDSDASAVSADDADNADDDAAADDHVQFAVHVPSAPADAPMFKRNDPRETPRPPDFSGTGLGRELESDLAAGKADPTRIKPEDALSEIYKPEIEHGIIVAGSDDLGQCLVRKGAITAEQLLTAERVLKQSPGKRLGAVLMELGIAEAPIQQTIAELAHLPFERIDMNRDGAWDERALNRLSPDYCEVNLLIPLRVEGSRLVVGTASPDDVFLLDDVKRRLGVTSVKHVLVTTGDIREVLDRLTQSEAEEVDINDILANVDEDDVEVLRDSVEEATADEADSSPVVRYVNHIIQTALKEGASDIHIEPDEKSLKVRFRIDGVLFEMMNPPRKMHAALTSRIKIMGNLDIAERRLPQDGRIRLTVLNRKLDLRVSTVPTPKGEKTVMRILDNRSISTTLDELGFAEDTLMIWKNQISQPHGIILVTGPTGSGKTTTLYSSLQQLDLRKLNVSTVEDPVEYNLSGITQIQTHDRIGMTFAAALRALMRQDPDVIMLGEIRDMETATIGIQAAMTGHLVLSTLHTNDAPASITRLINIGIEPFLVGAACNAVLAQRLVRRICSHCRREVPASDEMIDFLTMHGVNTRTVTEGSGCSRCRETGYAGRQGLYELLVLDDYLRDSIARNPNVTEFRRQCSERGMVTLREDGFKKVALGVTSVEEVLRVTESTI